jgi:hypothetical protein
MDEQINQVSRAHQETVKDWEYAEIGRLLYRFYDRINVRFFESKVPTPVLSFRHGRHCLGSYRNGRNESGVQENISISVRHLADSLADVIQTLAHEMVHSHQRNFGKPGRGNYHNRACRRRMDEIGIPCDKGGTSLGMRDPFVSFLREHGVEADARLTLSVAAPRAARSGTRLKRWFCREDCTTIWAIRDVAAHCTKCGCAFVRA